MFWLLLACSGPTVDDKTADSASDYEFRVALTREIENLPEREALVLSLYYDDELNLREIGEVLGVSESRVSQIHSKAVVRLLTGETFHTVDRFWTA